MVDAKRYNDGFDVDDLLHSSWGYDQTNATFYKVIKRTPAYVTLMKVQSRPVRSEDGYSVLGVAPIDEPVTTHQDCELNKDMKPLDWMAEYPHHQREHEHTEGGLPCFVPVTSRHKVSRYKTVRIASYANAYPYDPETDGPKYDTRAAGHAGH